MTKTRRINS